MDSHEVNHHEYHLHKLTVAPYVNVCKNFVLVGKKTSEEGNEVIIHKQKTGKSENMFDSSS